MRRITTVTFGIAAGLLLVLSMQSAASESVGIYAIVDKVVVEPTLRPNQQPERIQIWGTFSTNRNPASAKRGFFYFRLPFQSDARELALKEWKDLQAVAGSGQAVAFGQHYFYFDQTSAADAYFKALPRVRPPAEKPAEPDGYPINLGV